MTETLKLKYSKTLLGFSTAGVTLCINPWTNYDPINLPKMLVLVSSSLGLLTLSCFGQLSRKTGKSPLLIISAFIAGILLAFFLADSPWQQEFWGVHGRSTGLLTYLAFVSISISIFVLFDIHHFSFLLRLFSRTSYFVTFYTLIQFAKIDPIPWSQALPVATLGNINFMSSFLGLASSYFFAVLIMDKLHLVTKIHYLFFISLNLTLIISSQSIQGLGVFLIGFVVAIFFSFIRSYKTKSGLTWIVLNFLVGSFVLFGTAGIGPLGRLLVQDTVLFRIDYWKAGLAMFLANPLYGVGIDSYGDFYREFRDLTAVTRTGPSRISNTAHNVFLDVLSGGGMLAGVPFLMLVGFAFFWAFKSATNPNASRDSVYLSVLLAGWIFFLSISINQIGVTVWGFSFLGFALLFAKPRIKPDELSKLLKGQNSLVQSPAVSDRVKIVISLFGVVAGFIVSVVPVTADGKFLSVFKNPTTSGIESLIDTRGISTFHREFMMELLVKLGESEKALELARATLDDNPRSTYSFITILSNQAASPAELEWAADRLIKLDPLNNEIRAAISELQKP